MAETPIYYQDRGCKYAPSCLNCPYERCVYDAPKTVNAIRREQRNSKIVTMYDGGKSKIELATVFHLNYRTIERILRANDHQPLDKS